MLGQSKQLLGFKQLALFGAVLGLVFGTGAVSFDDASASGNDKIYICYKDKDKKIKEKDFEKYKAKGASKGKCNDDDDHDDNDKCKGVTSLTVEYLEDGPVTIEVTTKKGDPLEQDPDSSTLIFQGDSVMVTNDGKKFPSETVFNISDDDGTDTVKIHTSCSKPIAVGDVHGSLVITALETISDDKGNDKKFKKGNVLTGDGPPPDKLGKKGDLYFDSWDDDSLEYYVKIGKKEWELRGTLVEPSNDCERGDVLKFNKVDNKWVCVDGENLGGLTCSDGQIAKWNNTAEKWECQEDLVDDADADPANELQDLSLTGQDLSITPAGNTAELPFVFDDFNCPTDQAVIGFDGDGGTNCALVSGGGSGDITAVNTEEGSGLLGGGDEGDLDLEVDEDFIPFLSLENVFTSNMEVQGSLDAGSMNVLGLLEAADIFFEFFDGSDCTADEGCLPGEYLTDESVTTEKLAPDAVTLNVVRQLSAQTTIAAGQEATITIECDTGSITGFTLLNVGELPGTVLKSIDEGDTDPSTETLTVVNSAAASGTVKVAFYCAELSPLGLP